jgi:hypothetical protein
VQQKNEDNVSPPARTIPKGISGRFGVKQLIERLNPTSAGNERTRSALLCFDTCRRPCSPSSRISLLRFSPWKGSEEPLSAILVRISRRKRRTVCQDSSEHAPSLGLFSQGSRLREPARGTSYRNPPRSYPIRQFQEFVGERIKPLYGCQLFF